MLSAAKTLNAFISKLHFENGSQNFSGPLDRFCSNLQGLCKKVLPSEPGELFLKK